MLLRPQDLTINHFAIHNFRRPAADVVHTPDPFHLISGLELLGDAFSLGHLADQKVQHGVGLFVNLSEVVAEFAFCNQLRIDMPLGAFQIGCMGSAETTDHGSICLGIFFYGRLWLLLGLLWQRFDPKVNG